MDLKRAMLLRLAHKDEALYPDDPVKREKVYNKYKVGGTCSLSDAKYVGKENVLKKQVFVFLQSAAFWDPRGGSRVDGSESGGGRGETEAAGAQGNKVLQLNTQSANTLCFHWEYLHYTSEKLTSHLSPTLTNLQTPERCETNTAL